MRRATPIYFVEQRRFNLLPLGRPQALAPQGVCPWVIGSMVKNADDRRRRVDERRPGSFAVDGLW